MLLVVIVSNVDLFVLFGFISVVIVFGLNVSEMLCRILCCWWCIIILCSFNSIFMVLFCGVVVVLVRGRMVYLVWLRIGLVEFLLVD